MTQIKTIEGKTLNVMAYTHEQLITMIKNNHTICTCIQGEKMSGGVDVVNLKDIVTVDGKNLKGV
ncbi:MAG: hypothetical protein AAB707_00655 [Patescibacteria group bacterium]